MHINSIILYGIPNCGSVKKTRTQLDERGTPYIFYDFKKQGVPEVRMDAWLHAVGWEVLLNRKGTTWRKLNAATQDSVVDNNSAKAVMLANPSCIKRPLIEGLDGGITIGFTDKVP